MIAWKDPGLVSPAEAVGYGEGPKVMITKLKTRASSFGELLDV